MNEFAQLMAMGKQLEALAALATALRGAESCELRFANGAEPGSPVASMNPRREVVFGCANEAAARAIIAAVATITKPTGETPAPISSAVYSNVPRGFAG